MYFHPAVIQKIFARSAATYQTASALYQEAAHRLLEHLDWARLQPVCVLDLGAGTGHFTELLKKRYPYAAVLAVDVVKEVLQTGGICADAANLPLQNSSVDLVVSGLMLPWCNDNEAVFKEVSRVLKPGGLFLFSTFGPDTLGEMRASWASVDDQPHVHLFFDLHDVGDALLRAGFADPVMQTEWLTMLYQDVYQVCRDLKQTGSSNILLDRRMTLTGKKRFLGFVAEYETYRDGAGKLPATFEIVYGHCWQAAKKGGDAREILIPVSQIRR